MGVGLLKLPSGQLWPGKTNSSGEWGEDPSDLTLICAYPPFCIITTDGGCWCRGKMPRKWLS